MIPICIAMFVAAQVPSLQSEDSRDPSQVLVVVEDIRASALQIASAQRLAGAALQGVKKRVGAEAALYEGTVFGVKKLKRLVGGSDNETRDKLIRYYESGIDNAKFRVRVAFGTKKKLNWLTVACYDEAQVRAVTAANPNKKKRKKALAAMPALDTARFEDRSFDNLLAQLGTALETFCPAMSPPPPPVEVQKEPEPWSPPPRRD